MKEGVSVVATASSKIASPGAMETGFVPCLAETEE